jgi:hypothetical protein
MGMNSMATAIATSVGSDRQAYYFWGGVLQIARVTAVAGILILPVALYYGLAISLTLYVALMYSVSRVAKILCNAAADRHNTSLKRLFVPLPD